jgi:uncharacterized damage-inducible protein DinB
MATEYWLRGPVEDIPALLQPVAHALLQAREEIGTILKDFPAHRVWEQPYGVASVAFHLQHIAGVLDRLFTYALQKQLDEKQLAYLAAEGIKNETIPVESMLQHFNQQVDKAIEQLRTTAVSSLEEKRGVGRKQIPSNVIGLLFHAAEHTMRHNGQLLVTVRMVKQTGE